MSFFSRSGCFFKQGEGGVVFFKGEEGRVVFFKGEMMFLTGGRGRGGVSFSQFLREVEGF